jgi:hypothetical protein
MLRETYVGRRSKPPLHGKIEPHENIHRHDSHGVCAQLVCSECSPVADRQPQPHWSHFPILQAVFEATSSHAASKASTARRRLGLGCGFAMRTDTKGQRGRCAARCTMSDSAKDCAGGTTEEALGQAVLLWNCPSATVQAGLALEVLPAAPAVVPGSAIAVACNSHQKMASPSANSTVSFHRSSHSSCDVA